MTTKKNQTEEQTADPMDKRSEYDHENGVLMEPKPGDEPRVERKQVDPVRDPALFVEENNDNGPVPRRGDPYAHQRDTKAAEAGAKKEEKESAPARKAKEDDKK